MYTFRLVYLRNNTPSEDQVQGAYVQEDNSLVVIKDASGGIVFGIHKDSLISVERLTEKTNFSAEIKDTPLTDLDVAHQARTLSHRYDRTGRVQE